MVREKKLSVVKELKEKLEGNGVFYLVDASGMPVSDIDKFRQLCWEKGVEYKVYKNTLIEKALDGQDANYTPLKSTLKGFTSILFTKEVGNLPAKVLKEFQKKQADGKPALKAASIESDLFVGSEHLAGLVSLKSKNELIGDIVGLLQSPAKNVLSALQGSGQTLAGLIKAIEDKN